MFRRIPLHPLTCGKCAIVDQEDLPMVEGYEWSLRELKRLSYAYAKIDGEYRGMHQVIMGTSGDQWVDHKSTNGLNNCRSNLRLCTPAQNQQNQRKCLTRKSSKYKGVYYDINGSYKRPWCARITIFGKREELGRYPTQVEAALAYNHSAIYNFGEFARINVI